MRLGLVVLAHDRGLGRQGHELYRHLQPDATLAILTGGPQRQRPERYEGQAGCAVVDLERVRKPTVDRWMRRNQLDVLLACESFLVEDIPMWARAAGVKTVVQGNREFLRCLRQPGIPQPDLWLAPSTWDLDVWPRPVAYLPLGLDPVTPAPLDGPATEWVHVVGVPALADRAGTILVTDAWRHVDANLHLTVRAVTAHRLPRFDMQANVELVVGETAEHGVLYAGRDAVVLPRRYGGQSLVQIEALARGLPLVTLGRPPEIGELAGMAFALAHIESHVWTPGGDVGSWTCTPTDLAAAIERVASDPKPFREVARSLAAARDWQRLTPIWRQVLETVVAGERVPFDPAGLMPVAA